MISSRTIRWVGAAVLLIGLTVSGFMYADIWSSRSYVKPFATGGGWGYCVYYHNELLIRQSVVPAVQGVMEFPSRKKARRTGLLVLQRFQKGLDPTVTQEDLLRLRVIKPEHTGITKG
ncbi:MAG: DUF4907 domain-containing protein [Bacteroidales bacterium]|nr:DUF4907 domain-containing protein [Bacteroidales bacterium]